MSDRDPAAKSDRTAQARPSAPRVRLSCEACRQRKVKCDKLSPCTSCQRLGFVCVPVERARLPRGRTRKAPERVGSSDKELADRVAKLEQLLRKVAAERDEPIIQSRTEEMPSFNEPTEQSFEANVHVGDAEAWRDQIDDSSEMKVNTPENQPPRPRPMNSYMGSSFWEDIMLQTQELRSVLDTRVENEQHEFRSPLGLGGGFGGSEGSESVSNSPQSYKGLTISPQARRTLCDIYLSNVDPVFKVLHRPSLRAYLHDDQPYLDYEPDHQAPITLAFAVYSAAVCTIDDSQCHLLLGTDQKSAFADLQKETEAALTRVDFVTTNDLTVLQAYVISLLAARCQDQSRRVWTMLSMALRVAQAQCLHMFEPPFYVNPFEQEMRRRCWQAIGQLDVAASLDRASEPMMQVAWLESHPPANINDEDIWPGMEGPIKVPPEGTFTEMTHSLMVGESQSVCRSVGFADFIDISVKSLSVRQQILANCQKKIAILLAGCQPDRNPFHLYTKRVASIINGWLQLACVRPIIRSRNFNPPTIQGDVLLRMAGETLKRASESYSDPAMAPWRWFGALWVPWHGLAVALAELCVCQDPAIMSKYWPIVEDTYQITSSFIADSQHGMLWRPLEKLMNQARSRKREILGEESLTNAISQVSLEGMPLSFASEHLNHHNAQTPHNTVSFPLGSMEAPMIPFQPNAPIVPMAPMTMGFGSDIENWPSVWDAMDLTGTVPQGGYDVAWASYTNFIGDVYDSADSMFLPR
ncbi:hypothetical protein N7493_005142 [Penicillium malachiteum]|uniref:Zn(2)-C6 fungal-type domain-containing protein n=1 Tax=Penicillium malachiteum TaxID=1324776 RepID=A0AAD6HM56_9EURO|nr:hypothetical protein N7493_005142 [Penicillium malachiteum]